MTIIKGPTLRRMSEAMTIAPVATIDKPDAKANLPQRIESRCTGNRPSTQKLRPSNDMRGYTNRLVKVESSKAVTARFRKLNILRHEGGD
jgi:hypothetical protein